MLRRRFRRILETLRAEWRNSMAALPLPERGNVDMKYFISLSGNRIQNLEQSYHCAPALPSMWSLPTLQKVSSVL